MTPKHTAEIRAHDRFCTYGTKSYSNPEGTNCNCGAAEWNALLTDNTAKNRRISELEALLDEIENGGDCRLYAPKSSADDWEERRDKLLAGTIQDTDK